MIEWCSLNEYDMTLIEVMPMGDVGSEIDLINIYHSQTLRKNYQKNLI